MAPSWLGSGRPGPAPLQLGSTWPLHESPPPGGHPPAPASLAPGEAEAAGSVGGGVQG